MLIWIAIGLVMGLTALYELFEFAAAMLTKEPIVSPQGDPWDTHWDMVIGADRCRIRAHLLRKIS